LFPYANAELLRSMRVADRWTGHPFPRFAEIPRK
jgi:hypothetical protein